jgi:HEAT repeat protein
LSQAVDADSVLTDEQVLRTAGLSSDGPDLIEFFRGRTLAETDGERLAVLIGKLGSPSAAERDRATGELVTLGAPATPLLRQATRDSDAPEIAAGARRCLQFLESNRNASLPAVAARLLVQKKPPGAAQALLDYLPFADDDSVLEDVKAALAALVESDAGSASICLRALNDPSSLRRAVVAEILCKAGEKEVLPAVRKLLQDPRPVVRLRAALALAAIKDVDAIGTLIALLAVLPPALGHQAEAFLMNLAADQAPQVTLGDDESSRKACHEAWASWWRDTEGLAPLQEFRKRTLAEADREKVQALIKQLGDDDFGVRQRATLTLEGFGSSITPLLRQTLTIDDEEIKRRVRNCLEKIDKERSAPLLSVRARLVALRKPEGAVEVLLAYLPFADDESTLDEVRAALAAVAVRGGKPDPALVKGLEDRLPLRRGIAAEALVLGGAADQYPAVRKLLQDPEPLVRLRVALALEAKQDRLALPALIALLTEVSPANAERVEERLRLVAGETAPDAVAGDDDDSRKMCRDAWDAWWKKNGERVDLIRLGPRQQMMGYTVVVEQHGLMPRRQGRVVELDRRGKIRWQIEGLMGPTDAQVLPGDRVLICEQNLQRVSERDLKGKVLWERQINQPVVAQRLPNGNTFIVGRSQILEVDRSGKDIFTHDRQEGDIICGKKLRNGVITFVTNQGLCIRMDSSGKELKTIQLPPIQVHNGYVDMLANEHALVPLYGNNKVAEFDAKGKMVWEVAIQRPVSSRRLPNGNALVASTNPPRVVELDRSGRVVWENKDPVRPVRADRR